MKTGGTSAEDAEAQDEAEHEEKASKCRDTRDSPFRRSTEVNRLCQDYWPPRMEGKKGKAMPWLVLFHSPSGMECKKQERECTRTRDRWEALAKKVPAVSDAMVGA